MANNKKSLMEQIIEQNEKRWEQIAQGKAQGSLLMCKRCGNKLSLNTDPANRAPESYFANLDNGLLMDDGVRLTDHTAFCGGRLQYTIKLAN